MKNKRRECSVKPLLSESGLSQTLSKTATLTFCVSLHLCSKLVFQLSDMSSCTSNLHPSSSSINLFSNNNNSPKPSLSSLRFFTSTSPSSSVAPLSFSTTNHALSSPYPSNHIQSRQLRLRCQSPSPLFQLLPAVTAALVSSSDTLLLA